MHDLLRTALTGRDNQSVDIVRVAVVPAVLGFVGLAVWSTVWLGYAFDPLTYGTGFATLAGGIGAALKFKADTEPESK